MSIPLTFDWSTLAWLKLRAGAWWRRARLNPLALALVSCGVFAGCVPVTRFEETQSAAQVEMEGRRRAEHALSRLEAENAELRARAARQGEAIEQREQALAQAELDGSTLGKQRQEAEGMVEQLRGELARVGGHLQVYHDDKRQLETSRELEARRGRAMTLLARDVALALFEPVATGEYALDPEGGGVALRVPREKLLADDGSVKPEAQPLLRAVAKLMALHPQVRLRVEDTAAQGDAIAASHLVNELSALGVAGERYEPLAATSDEAAAAGSDAAAAPAAGAPQIVFGLSVP